MCIRLLMFFILSFLSHHHYSSLTPSLSLLPTPLLSLLPPPLLPHSPSSLLPSSLTCPPPSSPTLSLTLLPYSLALLPPLLPHSPSSLLSYSLTLPPPLLLHSPSSLLHSCRLCQSVGLVMLTRCVPCHLLKKATRRRSTWPIWPLLARMPSTGLLLSTLTF